MGQHESSKKFAKWPLVILVVIAILLAFGLYVWRVVLLPDRLYNAAGDGDIDILRSLLASGADPSISTRYGGWTPLHAAAHNDQVKAMQELLQRGADIDAKSDRGITPIWVAVRAWNEKAALLLIAAGADVNATVKDDADGTPGATPLHFAVQEQDLIVESLLRKGAHVNAKDKNGHTPLHRAVIRRGSPDVIKMLLSKGADINAKDSAGKTPLSYVEPSMKSTKQLLEATANSRREEPKSSEPGDG